MPDWDNLRHFLEVARTQRVSAAARRLAVEHTTVARRVRSLEAELGTLLFEKSRASGYTLTPDGERLFVHAAQIETALQCAREDLHDSGEQPSGHLRIGVTEGFGCYVLTPLATAMQQRHPRLTLDVMPVPRFVSLSRHEADLAITIEKPQRGPYVCSKLCDYALGLYATPAYLHGHAPIATAADLASHSFISYVNDLVFSPHLRYLEDVLPGSRVILRSTSVVAQYHATLQGHALAILPCFIAAQDPRLSRVLADEIQIERSFWMYCHEDLYRLRRIKLVWDYLRQAMDCNADLLGGREGAPRGIALPP